MNFIIGIDVGGTFTDIVILNLSTNELIKSKVLTDIKNPEKSIYEGLNKIFMKKRHFIKYFVHASTIASNTLLGQIGLELPKVALITTKGFKDIIEIGRQNRPELYNIFFKKIPPLVHPDYRIEVDERINSKGEIIKEINEEEAHDIVEKLKLLKPDAVAICFLNSYINPTNEVRLKNVLSRFINIPIVCSSEISNSWKEYERFSTTVINALLMPVMSRYLQNLLSVLSEFNISNKNTYIVASYGGFVDISISIQKPILTIESGPAAGIIACCKLSELLQEKYVISFDMGGTTAKISTIINYRPILTGEYEVGGRVHMGRRIKGTGYPIQIPVIDLVEISAGGGTIIWVDDFGSIRVGPVSAGADPGPACYGKGGIKPTITDANVILHRLNPKYLLNGEFRISKELSIKAFKEYILQYTNFEIEEAAYAAIKLINSHMARGIKIATIEKGYNPKEFTLIAYGGAGPLHACELANELGIEKVLIPLNSGVFTAFGLINMDFMIEREKSVYKQLSEINIEELKIELEKITNELVRYLLSKGFLKDDIVIQYRFYVRYVNQEQEIPIEISNLDFTIENIEEIFENKYKTLYGHVLEVEKELTVVKIFGIGINKLKLFKKYSLENESVPEDAIKEVREVYNGYTWVKMKVLDRSKLKPGNIIEEPVIIEDYDTTIYIPENWIGKIDEYMNIVLTRV